MADTAQGAAAEEREYSEAQIAVHWREEEYYAPPEGKARTAKAHHKDWPALLRMLDRRGVRYAE